MSELKLDLNKPISKMTEKEMKDFLEFYEHTGVIWQGTYWEKHQKILKVLKTVKKMSSSI